jgi:cytochrome c
MSTREDCGHLARSVSIACSLWVTGAATAQDDPALGVPVTEAEVAPWDISIEPDGTGLPPGSGTMREGSAIYAIKCLACHGAGGTGTPNDTLAGGYGTLSGPAPIRTVGSYWPYATTVFDYVRRAMPLSAPQSLSNDEVYALTAYLLAINGIIDADAVMNAETLPKVVMPNRDGFVLAYPAKQGGKADY